LHNQVFLANLQKKATINFDIFNITKICLSADGGFDAGRGVFAPDRVGKIDGAAPASDPQALQV
jgi:hypothetical protein